MHYAHCKGDFHLIKRLSSYNRYVNHAIKLGDYNVGKSNFILTGEARGTEGLVDEFSLGIIYPYRQALALISHSVQGLLYDVIEMNER